MKPLEAGGHVYPRSTIVHDDEPTKGFIHGRHLALVGTPTAFLHLAGRLLEAAQESGRLRVRVPVFVVSNGAISDVEVEVLKEHGLDLVAVMDRLTEEAKGDACNSGE